MKYKFTTEIKTKLLKSKNKLLTGRSDQGTLQKTLETNKMIQIFFLNVRRYGG